LTTTAPFRDNCTVHARSDGDGEDDEPEQVVAQYVREAQAVL
jgi:hypothetical protein